MKKIFIVLVIIALQGTLKAQDIHFSQFFYAPLFLNPSLTGVYGGNHRGILNYKDQWRSVASPYKTFAASYDTRFMYTKNDQFGVGASFYNDAAGDLKMGMTQFNMLASYQKQLTPEMGFSFGLRGGLGQTSLKGDVALQQWGNQYDGTVYNPNLPSGEVNAIDNFMYGDFSAGALWQYGFNENYITANDQFNIQFGVALDHINRPRQSFYSSKAERLDARFVFHGCSEIGISNTNLAVVPQFIYLHQGPASELNLGSMFKFKLQEASKHTMWIKSAFASLGGFYRAKDAFQLVGRIEFKGYSLGVSYDINTSNLREASKGKGGLEFSLQYIPPPTSKAYGKAPRIR